MFANVFAIHSIVSCGTDLNLIAVIFIYFLSPKYCFLFLPKIITEKLELEINLIHQID
ncbi:MAG: hypothetical protein UZ11_BCD004000339 [Bacteroidetes bacterium OLB11]|nr:MAG: hypothetical protein UZ11_BCD004000339 [Bacteroidetes bacterium OLB11]